MADQAASTSPIIAIAQDESTLPALNVSTAAAARMLGVAKHTLENWRADGKGPRYVKLGSRVLYPVDELRAFTQSRTCDPATGMAAAGDR